MEHKEILSYLKDLADLTKIAEIIGLPLSSFNDEIMLFRGEVAGYNVLLQDNILESVKAELYYVSPGVFFLNLATTRVKANNPSFVSVLDNLGFSMEETPSSVETAEISGYQTWKIYRD